MLLGLIQSSDKYLDIIFDEAGKYHANICALVFELTPRIK
jgi:hypothetical protein